MSYQFKTKPYAHQLRALEGARAPGGLPLIAGHRVGYAYLMDTRTGKSKTLTDEACMLYEAGALDGLLLLAPKGVYLNWVKAKPEDPGEFRTHMPDRIYRGARIVEWRAGGGSKAHQQLLLGLLEDNYRGLRVLVMNSEALSHGDKAVRFARIFLKSCGRSMLAVDESVDFANAKSSRTKALIGHWDKKARAQVAGLRDYATYRRILNGLLAPRGPLQVYPQFEVLQHKCLGFPSAFSFQCRYAVTKKINVGGLWDDAKRAKVGGRDVEIVVNYRNEDDLAERVARHAFRVRRDECWDLPKTVYTARDVELTDEQARMYAELKRYATAVIEGESRVSVQTVMAQFLRLHQLVCGFVVTEDGTETDVPSNRIAEMVKVIEQTDDKVIIWSRYRRSVTHIVGALREWAEEQHLDLHPGDEHGAKEAARLAVAQYHGGNVDERVDEQARFQSDPRCRFIVLTEAGAKGIKLTAGGTSIYFSNTWSLDKRSQSEDRPLGADQRGAHHCVDLVARGTVDEKILLALRSYIDISSAIMRDGYREWLI